jgi:hypothetical protein
MLSTEKSSISASSRYSESANYTTTFDITQLRLQIAKVLHPQVAVHMRATSLMLTVMMRRTRMMLMAMMMMMMTTMTMTMTMTMMRVMLEIVDQVNAGGG